LVVSRMWQIETRHKRYAVTTIEQIIMETPTHLVRIDEITQLTKHNYKKTQNGRREEKEKAGYSVAAQEVMRRVQRHNDGACFPCPQCKRTGKRKINTSLQPHRELTTTITTQ